ncbi:unnamed protein product [Tetraodon nigroviridis]|uniref:(spotted green pufferfish) hypothetical protein n=1 Tax=Tetraodon nigroviridis TaxID=99883 RepID=Q4RY23_TETNG|nr:unnamed protein product [Tetraodon nigroviridis]
MYSLFFISGLVGNLAALWVFLFLRSGRNSMRVFLINCAVADLVLLACLPFRIFYHANGNQWLMGSLAFSRERPDLPNALRYQRSAKKSFFVLFLFIVCFGPYHAFRPFYIFYQMIHAENCTTLQMVDQTNEVVLLLSAFNSCLDPVMYFLLSGSVRRATLQTLGHQLGKRFLFVQEGISNSSTTEFRRSSLPTIVLNTTSVAQSTLRRTSPKKAPPVNEMK